MDMVIVHRSLDMVSVHEYQQKTKKTATTKSVNKCSKSLTEWSNEYRFHVFSINDSQIQNQTFFGWEKNKTRNATVSLEENKKKWWDKVKRTGLVWNGNKEQNRQHKSKANPEKPVVFWCQFHCFVTCIGFSMQNHDSIAMHTAQIYSVKVNFIWTLSMKQSASNSSNYLSILLNNSRCFGISSPMNLPCKR